jgi:hypothetical protein
VEVGWFLGRAAFRSRNELRTRRIEIGLGLKRNGKPGVARGMSRLSLAIVALSFALLIGAFVLTVFTF